MVTTNNIDHFNKIRSLKDHGKSFTRLENKNFSQGYRYIHDNLGSNFRITEMQSSIGEYNYANLIYGRK